MKTRFRNLVLILLVVIIAAVVVWMYVFRKADTDVSSKKADYTLSSAELLGAFENNETDANQKYLNKIVTVTGTVESVSEDSVGVSVYLKEPDAMAGIICGFNSNGNDVTGIRKGTSIKVKGVCTGYLMDVVLNKCSIEESGR